MNGSCEAPADGTARRSDALLDASTVFAGVRPRLIGIAQRILGRRSEAEDVVQDAWVRWQGCDRSSIRNSTAFLVTATTRLAINAAQSARRRHEMTVGEWPREPSAADADPGARAERDEVLHVGLRVLLEALSPTERAAYVLRTAFDYPYSDIARILRLSESNARKVFSRASKHITCTRRQPADERQHQHLMRAFVAAARDGHLDPLEQLFSAQAA